jgi:hypothetical protein
MKDWKPWTTTNSEIALHGAGVQETVMKMWGYLRSAAIYNSQYLQNQQQDKYGNEAQTIICK